VVVALVLIRAYPRTAGRGNCAQLFRRPQDRGDAGWPVFHVLMHGTTIHGVQRFKNSDGTPITGRPALISYYDKDGGNRSGDRGDPRTQGRLASGGGDRPRRRHAYLCFRARRDLDNSSRSISRWSITARDPRYFTFVKNCVPDLKPVMGECAADLRARTGRYLRSDYC